MAISGLTTPTFNARGLVFEYVGDGATTAVPVTYPGIVSSNQTATAYVTTSTTALTIDPGQLSGRTGLYCRRSSTSVSATAAITISNTGAVTVTVTTSPAVGNGITACCEVLFNQQDI